MRSVRPAPSISEVTIGKVLQTGEKKENQGFVVWSDQYFFQKVDFEILELPDDQGRLPSRPGKILTSGFF